MRMEHAKLANGRRHESPLGRSPSNSVPMPAVGEPDVPGWKHRYCERCDEHLELPKEESVGLASPSESWSRELRTRGATTNVPGYSTFRAVLCEHHESGSSMRRVSASAVRVVGCRPSTMDSTISGARNAKRIKRPT